MRVDHPSVGGPRSCLAMQAMIVRISARSRMSAITDILLPQLGQERTCLLSCMSIQSGIENGEKRTTARGCGFKPQPPKEAWFFTLSIREPLLVFLVP